MPPTNLQVIVFAFVSGLSSHKNSQNALFFYQKINLRIYRVNTFWVRKWGAVFPCIEKTKETTSGLSFLEKICLNKLSTRNPSFVYNMIRVAKKSSAMAGHSQFKNIMHRKGAQDVKRAKMFAKIAREIMVSARISPDANSNPRLRAALASARAANMPRDNVERAMKKVAGGEVTDNYEEVRYEGFGPGHVAVIVECLTDNRHRTSSDVRSAFTKSGGQLGETGSVSYLFERVGVMQLAKETDFDTLFEAAVNAGAENVETTDESQEVTCSFEDFVSVRDALMKTWGDAVEANVAWRPFTWQELDDTSDSYKKLEKLLDVLEENDDVQRVFINAR